MRDPEFGNFLAANSRYVLIQPPGKASGDRSTNLSFKKSSWSCILRGNIEEAMEELSEEELRDLQVRVRRDHPGGEQELVIFRRQYLQKLDLKHISFPSRDLLQIYDIQRWIHSFICVPPPDEFHPKSDHDILNELVKRIEEAVTDAEEPDIYDPLVEFAAELCIQQRRPLTEAAQCDVSVSYECCLLYTSPSPRDS